ncbi:MAG TPA: hypothetical protein VFO65_04255 [Acidimicrobiales bacterium]|nr:hypothetical protein [Acidimicrobiales bacterium]
MGRVVRSWWPAPAMLAVVVVAQSVWSRGYDPRGHAADHFAGAGSVFAAAFVAGVLVWGVTPAARRRPELWVLAGLLVAAALLETVGNVRVVDAIGDRDWTDAEAAALGASRPGFEEGHELVELGGWGLKVTGLLLAAWLWWRGEIGRVVAAIAIVAAVAVPPWLLTGLAALVTTAGVLARRARRPPAPAPAPGP